MASDRGGIVVDFVPLTPEHVVDFPNRKKEKGPSRRVLFRGLINQGKEPDNVVAHLEPRGNNPNGAAQNPAAREVLHTVPGTTRPTEPANNAFTKPSPNGPSITPRPDKAGKVTGVEVQGHPLDAGESILSNVGIVGPPFDLTVQSKLDFVLGINFFEKPPNSVLHFTVLLLGLPDGVVGDRRNKVPSVLEGQDVR